MALSGGEQRRGGQGALGSTSSGAIELGDLQTSYDPAATAGRASEGMCASAQAVTFRSGARQSGIKKVEHAAGSCCTLCFRSVACAFYFVEPHAG